MTGLADHARQMVAYNEWANNKILDAAGGLTDAQFAEVSGQLTHMIGTQNYWHANWTHVAFVEIAPKTMSELRAAYDASHANMAAFVASLTDDDWRRSEQWWKQWRYEQSLPVGDTIAQVVNHSTQHRSEIAVVVSLHGHSPGDLDYITYLLPGMG